MKQKEYTPDEWVDTTRSDVINAMTSTCEIVGSQLIHGDNHGDNDFVVTAAKHLDKAQELLGKEMDYLRKHGKGDK